MGTVEYYGHTDARGDVQVTRAKDGVHTPLPLRLDLANHSPTGFNFGYKGSGCAQLALAILADYAGDAVALKHYQEFKERVIAKLPQDEPFTISGRRAGAAEFKTRSAGRRHRRPPAAQGSAPRHKESATRRDECGVGLRRHNPHRHNCMAGRPPS